MVLEQCFSEYNQPHLGNVIQIPILKPCPRATQLEIPEAQFSAFTQISGSSGAPEVHLCHMPREVR